MTRRRTSVLSWPTPFPCGETGTPPVSVSDAGAGNGAQGPRVRRGLRYPSRVTGDDTVAASFLDELNLV